MRYLYADWSDIFVLCIKLMQQTVKSKMLNQRKEAWYSLLYIVGDPITE